ncbi:MAG: RIP metalloprotease RseP [Lysobacterales bacterium]
MAEFIGPLWWYQVTIGILVTFHEFGHFWVARRCGVKVLRFSIGFGKPLWTRVGADGTEYVLAAIPLGGYVSMLDERVEDVPENLRGQAHNNKSTAQKIAIAAAGPAFNFLLAVLAFWLMFTVGKPDFLPVTGTPEGVAKQAGLASGSTVLAVDGRAYRTWSQVYGEVIEAALYRRDVELRVREPDGDERSLTLGLSGIPRETDDRDLTRAIGLRPAGFAFVAETLSAGDPAAQAGIQRGDRLLEINGKPARDFDTFVDLLQREAAIDPTVRVGIERAGDRLQISVTARHETAGDPSSRYLIGIGPRVPEPNTTLRYNPLAALPAALAETWVTTGKTLALLRDMLVGVISPKHLSGPVTIARVANAVASHGLAWFLGFLAAVSVGIAILNLLPVPILDGGHILRYLIESIRGRALSDRIEQVGQYLGLVLLVGLIGLALFNDLLR